MSQPTQAEGSRSLALHRIETPHEQRFLDLVAIYTAAHPSSERKPVSLLAAMVQRPEYLFVTVALEGVTVGFAIVFCFPSHDVCLLEYMAVTAEKRGQGIGQYLFEQLAAQPRIAERYLLVEVDSDKQPSSDRAVRAQRKLFYRKLGCKEIEGLNYIMPPVLGIAPPPMDIMVHRQGMPFRIAKNTLRAWLQTIYVDVYAMQATDSRIDKMLETVPEDPRLI